MAENDQAASNSSVSARSADSTTTTQILQTTDNVLNTLGEKIADVTGQHEAVQKSKIFPSGSYVDIRIVNLTCIATAFVEEKVLGVKGKATTSSKEEDSDLEAVHGFGAAKEHVDHVGDEKIEEFMRHQSRSYQG